MTNTYIKQLEMQIVELINDSQVNIATVALILDKLAKESQAILDQIILKEQQEMKATSEKEEEEEEAIVVEETK